MIIEAYINSHLWSYSSYYRLKIFNRVEANARVDLIRAEVVATSNVAVMALLKNYLEQTADLYWDYATYYNADPRF